MQISLKKLIKRIVLSGVLAAGVLGSAPNAYAGVEYLHTDRCGNTYWYSTGGSAGDTIWQCPAGGGSCTGYDPGIIINDDAACTVSPIVN
jgi:hypothetical protein